jgi:hypothetical protein
VDLAEQKNPWLSFGKKLRMVETITPVGKTPGFFIFFQGGFHAI